MDIKNVRQLNYADEGGTIIVHNEIDPGSPLIRSGVTAPCEPYIEGPTRANDLTNIKNLLKKSRHVIWVYGEGGIGKTELMLRFAEVYPEYEYIFTSFKGSINQTVSQNLFFLQGYEMKGIELTDVVRYQQNLSILSSYHNRLKREKRNIILIIDNYDSNNYEKTFREMTELDINNDFSGGENDYKTLQELLKTGIDIIITTRTTPESSDEYLTYEVKKMDESDLFEVMTGCFTRIIPFLEVMEVRRKLLDLIKIAESNTVFISIMAFAMQSSELSPIEALDSMIDRMGADHSYHMKYSGKAVRFQDHMEKVLRFIGLSYQDKQVLGMLTMIPSEGIDYNLYQKITISGAVQLDQKRQRIFESFRKRNIIIQIKYPDTDSYKNANSFFYMHSLVADHAQRVLINEDVKGFFNLIDQNWLKKLLYYFDDEKLESISFKDKDFQYLSQIAEMCSETELKIQKIRGNIDEPFEEKILDSRRRLLLKAAQLSEKSGNIKNALEYIERAINIEGPSREDLETLWRSTHMIGCLLYEGGKYSKAIHYFLIELQILNDRNGIYFEDLESIDTYIGDEIVAFNDDNKYVSCFNNMALVYNDLGNYEMALQYFKIALAIIEKVLGTDHPDTATMYNNVAHMYYAQGNYEKALEYNEKAQEIKEKVLGKEHLDTATTYNNIASVYSVQGDYEKALEYNEKALAIIEKVLGREHPTTATIYGNIGVVYHNQGNYEKALEYEDKAREIREKVLGKEHPVTAMTFNNIACVYSDQGNYEKALEYNEKALAIIEKVLGKEHPSMATTCNNIALVYSAQCNNEKALEYFEKAREIREKVSGKEHPDTAMTYNNIAGVYSAQGKYEKALEYNEKALEIIEKVLGKEHPSMATTCSNIASVYSSQCNNEKALEYYEKAREIREKVLGKEHPDTAMIYNNIAGVYRAQGKYEKALEYNEKAQEIREKVLGKEHPDTATTYNNIAGVYRAQGKYEKALEYNEKAQEIREKVLGKEHPDTAMTYINIASVYRAQGKYKKALEYFEKALIIFYKKLGQEHPYTKKTIDNIESIKRTLEE